MQASGWRHPLALFFVAAICQSTPLPPTESYIVRGSSGEIVVDGKLDEAAWESAAIETSFTFPWQQREAPATEFRALADDARFYFAFRVEDADIVIDDGNDEAAVARGDRVELFFAPDLSLGSYFCLEIDPGGRVLDYRAAFYRDFDDSWDLPGLVVATAISETGYVVEASIPHAALREAGLPTLRGEGRQLAGIFRAELSHLSGAALLEEWISWVRPSSDEPDFHIPSAFGWLVAR